jgi:hypothetical protein
MCRLVLIGTESEPRWLRQLVDDVDGELDTDVSPAAWTRACFPASDAVVCVTRRGCSCELLEGIGSGRARREAHFAGPGYSLRRVIATAVAHRGSVRLLVHGHEAAAQDASMRVTTLASFLRCGLEPDDRLLLITA